MSKAYKSVRLIDIAHEAGVSQATISRAINNPSKTPSATYAKIVEAANRLNYKLPASSPPAVNTVNRCIILNIPHIGNSVFTRVVEGINSFAESFSWQTLISTLNITTENCDNFIEMCRNCNAVGLIASNHIASDILKKINSVIPVVQLMECDPALDIPYVAIDDYTASADAVEYLITTHREKIGFVSNISPMRCTQERKRAFLDVMQKHNITVEPSMVIYTNSLFSRMIRTELKQAIQNLAFTPDAFFCSSDQIASELIVALRDCNYRIPQDVAVIGFDNTVLTESTTPKLTSIDYPKFDAGYMACQLLHERVLNPNSSQRSLILDTQLILRQST